MRNSGRRKKKTIQGLAVITVIIAAAAVAGGVFLWKQAEKNRSMDSGNAVGEGSAAVNETIEYNGQTYRYNDHLSNYLFMGIDTTAEISTYESQQDAGQADSIFVVSMDRVTEEMKVLLIPRDTITEIEVFNPSGQSLGTSENHINIQYAYGDGKEKSCELMETAVSGLLKDIPIHGYCAMNMDGIAAITDLVGGVEVTVPDASLEEVNPEFREGAVVTLTGENAEQFVRYRNINEKGSSLVRQERQKTYMRALLAKAREAAEKDAGFVVDMYDSIQPYTVTSLGTDVFAQLLAAADANTTDAETVPGEMTHPGDFDEYHVNEEEFTKLLIEMFYKN